MNPQHGQSQEAPFLYESVLGHAFDQLSPAIRAAHSVDREKTLNGLVDVQRGTNLLAILLANCFRFPKSQMNVPISVTMEKINNREIWTRKIGNSTFRSALSKAGNPGFITEQFGPIKFHINLVWDKDRLYYNIVFARFFGIKLPKLLTPKSVTYEKESNNMFVFDVDIALPFLGTLIKYRGTLS